MVTCQQKQRLHCSHPGHPLKLFEIYPASLALEISTPDTSHISNNAFELCAQSLEKTIILINSPTKIGPRELKQSSKTSGTPSYPSRSYNEYPDPNDCISEPTSPKSEWLSGQLNLETTMHPFKQCRPKTPADPAYSTSQSTDSGFSLVALVADSVSQMKNSSIPTSAKPKPSFLE